MKKLFKKQNVSLYRIQRDLKLEVKRLYRYADGTCKIENMPIDLLMDLSNYFEIELDELYKLMVDYEREKNEKNNKKYNN